LKNHLFFYLLIVGFSCKNKREVATPRVTASNFYYWKQQFKLKNTESAFLNSSDRIYVKFFDIVKQHSGGLKPVAIINFTQKPSKSIVPVVFITNQCFYNSSNNSLEILAQNSLNLLNDIAFKNKFTITELQFDCDWTRGTAKAYFQFLQIIKRKKPEISLTCTIRLHQIKFPERMGIPPVNRGTLMCYNMGAWNKYSDENSIFSSGTLQKYTDRLQSYPLNLDLALPLFSWTLWYRNGQFKGIVNGPNNFKGVSSNKLVSNSVNVHIVPKDTLFNNLPLKHGDILKHESVSVSELINTKKFLLNHWPNNTLHITYFHLDSTILVNHNYAQLSQLLKN
jgi:hypothetical protein